MVLTPVGEVSVTVQEASCTPPLLGSLNAMAKLGNFGHGRRIRYQEKVWWDCQTEGRTGARPSHLGYTGRGKCRDSGGGWRRVTRETSRRETRACLAVQNWMSTNHELRCWDREARECLERKRRGQADRGGDSCSLAAAITIVASLLFFPWCVGDRNRRPAASSHSSKKVSRARDNG